MSEKKDRLNISNVSIGDLVEMKKKGASIRKLVYGLTAEQYGHIYSVGGYRVTCDADPEEIRKALRKVKKGVN